MEKTGHLSDCGDAGPRLRYSYLGRDSKKATKWHVLPAKTDNNNNNNNNDDDDFIS